MLGGSLKVEIALGGLTDTDPDVSIGKWLRIS